MTVLSYFEVHNDPTWMNIGFSISILSREDGKWRKGAIKCSRGHLAVNIAWCKASCCAEQPPVSMGGSDQRYRTRRKAGCLGRKQEFIFESGVWTYILCNLWRADTWPGESNYFYFLFSAAVTKAGGWTTSLGRTGPRCYTHWYVTMHSKAIFSCRHLLKLYKQKGKKNVRSVKKRA